MTTDSAASTDSASATRTRLIMTGGFLGAGKTTLLLRLGEWLSSRGLRVGLVHPDDRKLVDRVAGAARLRLRPRRGRRGLSHHRLPDGPGRVSV